MILRHRSGSVGTHRPRSSWSSDLDAEGGWRTAADVEALGGRAISVETDATDADSVSAAVDAALADFDSVEEYLDLDGSTPGARPLRALRRDGRARRLLRLRALGLRRRQALLSDGGLLLTISRPRRDGLPEVVAKLRASAS